MVLPIKLLPWSRHDHFVTVLVVVLLPPLLLASRAVALNPSGDCVADDDGGRKGYHSPSPSDTYLPDCQNPLNRELYRVFKKESNGMAYIIPRPDGLGDKYNLCNDDGIPSNYPTLYQKANQYGLCNNNNNSINNIPPADALAFTNAIHRQLQFVAIVNDDNSDIVWIDPYVPDNDLLDACDILTTMTEQKSMNSNNDGVEAYCSYLRNRCNDDTGECFETFFIPSADAINAIVPVLNNLYGVSTIGDECVSEEWGVTFACPVAKCAAAPNGCTYETKNEINDVFDCCPRLCYAVNDETGQECNYDYEAIDPNSSTSSNATMKSTIQSFCLVYVLLLFFDNFLINSLE